MKNKPKILAVITARGGSKGLPRKNILPLAGKPLIAYSIEAALGLKNRLHRLIVSTDDEEITEISNFFGADVPFKRPPNLSSDTAASIPVLQHAVEFAEEEEDISYDIILLLQPTSPLCTTDDLNAALDIMEEGNFSAVRSVTAANETHPLKMKVINDGVMLPYDQSRFIEGMRRQDYIPDVYKTNGAICIVARDVLMNESTLFGEVTKPYIMPADRSIDIDTKVDFYLSELILQGNSSS